MLPETSCRRKSNGSRLYFCRFSLLHLVQHAVVWRRRCVCCLSTTKDWPYLAIMCPVHGSMPYNNCLWKQLNLICMMTVRYLPEWWSVCCSPSVGPCFSVRLSPSKHRHKIHKVKDLLKSIAGDMSGKTQINIRLVNGWNMLIYFRQKVFNDQLWKKCICLGLKNTESLKQIHV